jgi:cell division septation protein DedD
MRDGNRLKEKIELHLDRRQVTSLSVVALLLSASIFALGVMVGKNLSPPTRASAPAEALLDRLDAQADGGPGQGDSLTFQDELTKKLPPAPLPKPAKQAAPTIPLPAAPVAAPPEAPSFVAPPPTAVAAALIDAGGYKPLALSELTEKDSGVEVAVASKLPMIRVPPAPKSFFTVQVKATQSSNEADKFAKKLRGQGYQSLVAEAEVEGKGKWYRVRVGKFDTRAQADHYLQDFKRETHLEAFVTAAGH